MIWWTGLAPWEVEFNRKEVRHSHVHRPFERLPTIPTENNYFAEMCSGSEAGSHVRLIDFVYHSRRESSEEERRSRLISASSPEKRLGDGLNSTHRDRDINIGTMQTDPVTRCRGCLVLKNQPAPPGPS